MNTQTAKAIIFRIVACALCVLLVSASLDTIPDPPAVMQHQQHNLVVSVHKNTVSPTRVLPIFLSIWAPLVRFKHPRSYNVVVDLSTDNLDFLSQASDPSPPFFS